MIVRWDSMYEDYNDDWDRFEEDFDDELDDFVCPFWRQGPGAPFNQITPPPFGPSFQGPPSGAPFLMPQPSAPGGAPFQGPASGPPSGPPPGFTPQKAPGGVGVKAVDPGAIRRCTFRFVFIWPERGRGFWAFLVFVGPRSIAGWRWNGRRWVYFGMDLRRIDSFVCY